MSYNQIRHLELLRRLKDLKIKGKSLYDKNQGELLSYRLAVEDHVFWKSRR